jgi:polar amino acid transport system substrate-binding protein
MSFCCQHARMKRIQLFAVILFWQLCLLGTPRAHAEELVIAYGKYDVAPFAIVDGEKLVGGIIKDLGIALARELGMQPVFLDIPRKRMPDFIANGDVHIRIGFNPMWVNNPERFNWSQVLFDDKDLIVINKQSEDKVTKLDDLKGGVVGTILGHVYPDLEGYFSNRTLRRDNALSLTSNLDRLSMKRIEAVVTSKRSYDFYLLEHGQKAEFEILDPFPQTNEMFAMFSKQLPISFERIEQACGRLKTKGKIDEILRKYQQQRLPN